MITDKILKYLAFAACLAALALASVQTWRLHSAQEDKAEAVVALATERREAAVRLVQEQAQIRKTENALQLSALQTREQVDAAARATAADRTALLERVRLAELRAKRLLTAVSSATAAAGDTEAGLIDHSTEVLATIGAADVDEASRADLIRAALLGCYRDYDSARAALASTVPK